jgi:flavin reductase (DIM6/NTAB) family NADH-FMN oxidoreductase RutF
MSDEMDIASVGDVDGVTPMDIAIFREVLSTFPAGVVVVTALGEGEVPAGLTISAFCSVSADPTLILVCVDKGSNTLRAIRSSGKFTVNILAAGREDLALRFASKREDKFDGVSWEPPQLQEGGPILRSDAASYLVCRIEQEIEAGDHQIFIGEAVEAGVQHAHPPLLYHNRGFASLA